MASDFGSAVFAWFNAKVESLDENTREAVKEITREGAEITEHHVRTRGINKPGRIDTGQMVDSVGWIVDKESADEVQARFGFLPEKDAPPWVKYQEPGTYLIAPMYALTDAANEIGDKLSGIIGSAIRRS